MKTFEEKFTAWLDGTLSGQEHSKLPSQTAGGTGDQRHLRRPRHGRPPSQKSAIIWTNSASRSNIGKWPH